jgi:hypothetical protein
LDVADANYRIYPGQIVIVDGNVIDYNTPYAPGDLGDANVTVEMGSLYTMDANYAGDPNAGYNKRPGLSGTLLKFYTSGNCTYAVTENAIRGGIVMEDPNEDPNVTLCSGSVVVGCTVPSVVGKLRAVADVNITNAGLVPNGTGVLSCVTLNQVLAQSPAGSTVVTCGSTVDYNYSLYQNTVPNIVGMKAADANAALLAAGFTVGVRTAAYSDTVQYLKVISQLLTGVQTCGTAVGYTWSEGSDCYVGRADYTTQWTPAGRPCCWCYPRQCHGDADGKKQGSVALGYNYVGSNDLDIMGVGWLVLDPPKGPGILGLEVGGVPVACADFKHDRQGSVALGYNRIGSNDLDEMGIYWLVLESPKGPNTPANCLPGNETPTSCPK